MCTYCTFKGDIGPQGVSGVKGEKGKAGDSGIDGCRCKGQKVCLSVCLLLSACHKNSSLLKDDYSLSMNPVSQTF
jgi:hypothetical protein